MRNCKKNQDSFASMSQIASRMIDGEVAKADELKVGELATARSVEPKMILANLTALYNKRVSAINDKSKKCVGCDGTFKLLDYTSGQWYKSDGRCEECAKAEQRAKQPAKAEKQRAKEERHHTTMERLNSMQRLMIGPNRTESKDNGMR